VSEFVSEGEIFHKIKQFSRQLVQLYIAELAIVIGEQLDASISRQNS
jgi:hypothetical protein